MRGEGEKSKGREGDERRYVCREGEEGVGRERREEGGRSERRGRERRGREREGG